MYEARAVTDGTVAAVKVLPTGALAPGQRAALGELVAREARFSAEADHPHLVRTHAVCTVDAPDLPALDGAIALVMDRAEASLRQALDAAGTGGPIPDAVLVLCGVAAGLAQMHGAGWVHGDLKPANVLLGGDGAVWLATSAWPPNSRAPTPICRRSARSTMCRPSGGHSAPESAGR